MTQDKSREKSLLFLLSATSNSLEVSPEYRKKIRESIATLQIEDHQDKWAISTETSNNTRKNIKIAKDRFVFYPVKSAARYETNPAILNKNSAQEVLLALYAEYGVQVPGKRTQPTWGSVSDFFPTNLILLSLVSIFSIYDLKVISLGLILFHLFITTSKYQVSALNRLLLMASIMIPALGFLMLNKSEFENRQALFSQIALFYLFDLTIRFESLGNSNFKAPVVNLLRIMCFLLIAKTNIDRPSTETLIEITLIIGYVILRQKMTSSKRNILFLLFLLLFVIYIVVSIAASPLKILLVPYLIYVAFYEALFGDNRNPSKLAIGSICLAI